MAASIFRRWAAPARLSRSTRRITATSEHAARLQAAPRPPYQGRQRGPGNKRAIVSLVEREAGNVRSFHVPTADAETVAKIVRENVHRESRLHTDESNLYVEVGKEFAAHETVNHAASEYARGDVTTNTVEGYFGIFKRGMRGNYQHCAEKELAPLSGGIRFPIQHRDHYRW